MKYVRKKVYEIFTKILLGKQHNTKHRHWTVMFQILCFDFWFNEIGQKEGRNLRSSNKNKKNIDLYMCDKLKFSHFLDNPTLS